jgi:hypothetical protein
MKMANSVDKRKYIKPTLLAILVIMLTGSLQTYAQGTMSYRLSDEDKTEIIRSILRLTQSSIFTSSSNMYLSSENIEFIKPSAVSEFRVVLISSTQIERMKEGFVHDYVVFRSFEVKNEKVIVSLSRITEGRPCFAPAFSREQKITYEYGREAGIWEGELVRHSVPLPFPLGQNLNLKQPKYIWAKPNKSLNRTRN